MTEAEWFDETSVIPSAEDVEIVVSEFEKTSVMKQSVQIFKKNYGA
ncbi:hypothetical protein ApDm4_0469 [Acetobacter pomorum]|nr:hypothetical protein ApDm4_0469 [Acetobacter pomorum]